MAKSPAHSWGQLVGNIVESGALTLLEDLARTHDLYLDRAGPRPARPGKKLTWTDSFGNIHDLDYVLERGGTRSTIGDPVAFVEVAWRRYTKHSRNKAQEIQGAVLPLADTYQHLAPFLGAIVAGEFTDDALTQLRSVGFSLLYLPYEEVLAAFNEIGIDASSEETTDEADFVKKLEAWESIGDEDHRSVTGALFDRSKAHVQGFIESLETAITRTIRRIVILPLSGEESTFTGALDAMQYLAALEGEAAPNGPLVRIEVRVEYTNDDSVVGTFGDATGALGFLRTLE